MREKKNEWVTKKNIKIECGQRFENDNKICKHKLNYKQNMKKKIDSHIKKFYINTLEVGQKISFFIFYFL